eukprot:6204040-Pleurochrysis_carterae.AAC.1
MRRPRGLTSTWPRVVDVDYASLTSSHYCNIPWPSRNRAAKFERCLRALVSRLRALVVLRKGLRALV